MLNESTVVVPPISHEQRRWNPLSSYRLTRREQAARGRTYESAVPARIAEMELDMPAALGAAAEESAAEIARFDEATQHGIGAIAAVLLRSESASSSQIEQISASARAIAEAELNGSGSGNAAVVADNMHAMTEAIGMADDVTAAGIADVRRVLLERHSPDLLGWRTEPVWICGGGSTPVTADYVAPDHRRIAEAIDDLIRFAARDDLPVLPQIAITHAQVRDHSPVGRRKRSQRSGPCPDHAAQQAADPCGHGPDLWWTSGGEGSLLRRARCVPVG